MEPRDTAHLVGEIHRAQQGLRGHAGVEGAVATHERRLDDGDGQAVLTQSAGRHLAGRAGSHHHDIECSHALPVVE